jgi:hypothetical protein
VQINAARRLELVSVMLADFNNRWGDGTLICEEQEGIGRQPRGLTNTQCVATALDPETRDLKGVPQDEHEQVPKP